MNTVILTGAGISAESGIRTFRGHDGLWESHRLEDVATPEAFARDPALVHRFYNERRRQLQQPDIRPNAAHLALAHLEQQHTGTVTLVTQNIDDLHVRAGSRNLLHMHGELLSVLCPRSHKRRRWTVDCQLFISIGTSGNVYPAAGFVRLARRVGARCIEVNLEGSMISSAFHEHRVGPASIEVPRLVEEILGEKNR